MFRSSPLLGLWSTYPRFLIITPSVCPSFSFTPCLPPVTFLHTRTTPENVSHQLLTLGVSTDVDRKSSSKFKLDLILLETCYVCFVSLLRKVPAPYPASSSPCPSPAIDYRDITPCYPVLLGLSKSKKRRRDQNGLNLSSTQLDPFFR